MGTDTYLLVLSSDPCHLFFMLSHSPEFLDFLCLSSRCPFLNDASPDSGDHLFSLSFGLSKGFAFLNLLEGLTLLLHLILSNRGHPLTQYVMVTPCKKRVGPKLGNLL